MPPQPRRPDRTGLIFVGVTLLVLAAGIVMMIQALMSERPPEPARTASEFRMPAPLAEFVEKVEGAFRTLKGAAIVLGLPGQEKEQPAQKPSPVPAPQLKPAGKTDPQRAYPALARPPAAPHRQSIPHNATWTYDVFFGPSWSSGGRLDYQTQAGLPLRSSMAWTPNGGQTQVWILGVVQANHASHANTRFPGFFMHAVYLPPVLEPGMKVQWEIPWQGGPGKDRARRYDMTVAGWETVQVPAGEMQAARLDGTLSYVDAGDVKATVKYTLWYAPKVRQTVRVRWIGKAPDESSAEMIVELASYRGL